jgi:DNA-binding MarR family transcriptional regulator
MIPQLKKLGLSEAEIKVYETALMKGSATIAEIAVQAEVKRPTAYVAAERLEEMGLFERSTKGKKTIFSAGSPEKLRNLARRMRRKVIAAELALEELLPRIETLLSRTSGISPQVYTYEGLAGVKSVIEDIAVCREPWYFFGSSEEAFNLLGVTGMEELFVDAYRLRKMAGQPTSYFITDEGFLRHPKFHVSIPPVREMRFFTKPIPMKAVFIIYGNKVAFLVAARPPHAIVIESEEIAIMTRAAYHIMWDSFE